MRTDEQDRRAGLISYTVTLFLFRILCRIHVVSIVAQGFVLVIGQVCILSQTREGPLLFSKESVTLTRSQGYCLINTEPPA